MVGSDLYWVLSPVNSSCGLVSGFRVCPQARAQCPTIATLRWTIYIYIMEISPQKLIFHWLTKFRHTWRMFANLLKKTKHPTPLHVECLVLRTISEKCSKQKENKALFKKYQENVLVECSPRKQEALNLISILCKCVVHTCNLPTSRKKR